MKDILTVFRFTFLTSIRKKSFAIITILFMLILVAGFAIVGALSGSGDGSSAPPAATPVGQRANTCWFADDSGVLPGAVDALNQASTDTQFVAITGADVASYQDQVKSDATKSIVVVSPPAADGQLPGVKAYISDFSGATQIATITDQIRTLYIDARMTAANVPSDVSALTNMSINPDITFFGKSLGGYIIGIVVTMIMFFAIYFYGYIVASSVASEKTSRVMETLVVAVKPSRILIGKCVAMGLQGLLQICIWLITGALAYRAFIPAGFAIGGMPLSLSAFTVPSALLTIVYFVLGFALFAMISSVCGSTVSRAEELQMAMMPSMLISIVSFYVAYLAIVIPGTSTSFKNVVSYIPFTAPFVMPSRLLNETLPAGEVALSLLFLVAMIVLVAALSSRVYTASVLHYGERIKLRNLWKLKA